MCMGCVTFLFIYKSSRTNEFICMTWQRTHEWVASHMWIWHGVHMNESCSTLQHNATHCNTLQHTATHCNTLQHTAAHCNTLQHTATYKWVMSHFGLSHVGNMNESFHTDEVGGSGRREARNRSAGCAQGRNFQQSALLSVCYVHLVLRDVHELRIKTDIANLACFFFFEMEPRDAPKVDILKHPARY